MVKSAYISCPLSVSEGDLEKVIQKTKEFNLDRVYYYKKGTAYDTEAYDRIIQSHDAFILVLPNFAWAMDYDKMTSGCRRELKIARDAKRKMYLAYKTTSGLVNIYVMEIEHFFHTDADKKLVIKAVKGLSSTSMNFAQEVTEGNRHQKEFAETLAKAHKEMAEPVQSKGGIPSKDIDEIYAGNTVDIDGLPAWANKAAQGWLELMEKRKQSAAQSKVNIQTEENQKYMAKLYNLYEDKLRGKRGYEMPFNDFLDSNHLRTISIAQLNDIIRSCIEGKASIKNGLYETEAEKQLRKTEQLAAAYSREKTLMPGTDFHQKMEKHWEDQIQHWTEQARLMEEHMWNDNLNNGLNEAQLDYAKMLKNGRVPKSTPINEQPLAMLMPKEAERGYIKEDNGRAGVLYTYADGSTHWEWCIPNPDFIDERLVMFF